MVEEPTQKKNSVLCAERRPLKLPNLLLGRRCCIGGNFVNLRIWFTVQNLDTQDFSYSTPKSLKGVNKFQRPVAPQCE